MNRPISSARERVFDHTLHSLRPHRTDHYLTTQLLSDSQSFFQGVAVRFTNLERQVALFDPGSFFIDSQYRVFIRDLFHHHYDFHSSINP
jgi:hypothetical protein